MFSPYILHFLLGLSAARAHILPTFLHEHDNAHAQVQLRGALLCENTFAHQSLPCWYLKPMGRYDVKREMRADEHGYPYTLLSSQTDIIPDSARFNFHIYLDHMWHINIGTT